MRHIADKYFKEHPDQKDEVVKAYFAYHTHHIRQIDGAHNFNGPWKDCVCQWCGRSRMLVRWDDEPAQCQKRPELPDIKETIKSEEQKAFALIKRAEKDVPYLIEKMGMSGDTLAILHHTHGYVAEIVDAVVHVPPDVMRVYYEKMEQEKERSRSAMVKKTIKVKTVD